MTGRAPGYERRHAESGVAGIAHGHLVRQGADVVTVCRQMGHARPSITLDVSSNEFAAVQHRDSVASRLIDAFSGILAGSGI